MNPKRMFFTGVFISCLFLVGGQSASAEDWRPIKDSNSFFDASRITRVSPSVIRAWERVFPERYPQDPTFSVLLRFQIDCRKQTIGIVHRTHYNSNGRVIYDADFERSGIKMQKAVPDSHEEDIVQSVCDHVNAPPKKKKRGWKDRIFGIFKKDRP